MDNNDFKELLKYGFYDECGKYIVNIDEEKLMSKLKEIFKADDIIFKEEYRRS